MTKKTFNWLLLIICAIALGAAVGLLVGCGDAKLALFNEPSKEAPKTDGSHAYNPTPPASTPTPNLLDGLSSAELKKEAVRLEAEILRNKKTISDLVIADNQKTVDLEDVRKQITDAENREWIHSVKVFLLWIGGICIFAALALAALSRFPVIKMLPSIPLGVAQVLGLIGGGAILLAFLTAYVIVAVKWILIGLSLVLIAAIFFAVRWIVFKLHAFYQVAATGQAAMDTLKEIAPEAHDAIKEEAKQVQSDLGVRGMVDKILAVARDVIEIKPTAKEITTRIELPPEQHVEHAPSPAISPQDAVTSKLAVLNVPRPPIN